MFIGIYLTKLSDKNTPKLILDELDEELELKVTLNIIFLLFFQCLNYCTYFLYCQHFYLKNFFLIFSLIELKLYSSDKSL
jgi:hypothetical protein